MNSGAISDNSKELRSLIRHDELFRPTCGLAPDYAQANVAILPKDHAFDFFLFCQRNPKPCPIVEVLEPGKFEPAITTPHADIRTDIPLYRIYRYGELVGQERNLVKHWNNDLVTFLLGCSFTFESALTRAGIGLRHIAEGKNIAMYVTRIQTVPAGIFSGPLVVSMRPIPIAKVPLSVQITSRFPSAHGTPIHIGDPEKIGILDLAKPDYGDPVEIKRDETPVFWACGVTSHLAALKSKLPLMITHAPGYMFITDLLNEDLAVL